MNYQEVMERVGEIVEYEIGREPYDKDIAEAIGLSPASYNNNKQKDIINFERVADYCARNKVSINWVMYGQDPKMLEDNTEEIFHIGFFRGLKVS